MNCEDLLKAINEYVDGEAGAGICEELRKHLADCNPCKVVVDTVKKTITLYKAGKPYELPGAFRDQLHMVLRERWKSRFMSSGSGAPPVA